MSNDKPAAPGPAQSPFWAAISKLRKKLTGDASALLQLKSQPAAFLTENDLDVQITLGTGKVSMLSALLESATAQERAAILDALFSLSGQPRFGGNGAVHAASVSVTPSSDPSNPLPSSNPSEIGLALANVLAYINANAAENANAVANANANTLANANANVNANANGNVNTNGAKAISDSQSVDSIKNVAANQKSVELPPSFDATALGSKLREMGLSRSRQVALLKRAITSDVASEAASGVTTYTYREVTFAVSWTASQAGFTIDEATVVKG